MSMTYSEFIGTHHEENSFEFIMKQLAAQKHLTWTFGTSEQIRLPAGDDIKRQISIIDLLLSCKMNESSIDNRYKMAKQCNLSLASLFDQQNIQIDILLKIEKNDQSDKDSFYLTDNKVEYELELPCILQVEATSSNRPNRIFDKFLKGIINAEHLLATPVIFFRDLYRKDFIQEYFLYHVIVTEKKWRKGLDSLKLLDKAIFKGNDKLMAELPHCQFLDANLLEEKYASPLYADKRSKTERLLRSLPFGLLNLEGLNFQSKVEITEGRPQFKMIDLEEDAEKVSSEELRKFMRETDEKFTPMAENFTRLEKSHYEFMESQKKMTDFMLGLLFKIQNDIDALLDRSSRDGQSSKDVPMENQLLSDPALNPRQHETFHDIDAQVVRSQLESAIKKE